MAAALPQARLNRPFGVPSPVFTPVLRQQAVAGGTGSASVTLPLLPIPGNLLVAVSGTQEFSGTPTASGGGVASWAIVARIGIASGTQFSLNMFYGRSGSTPSRTVSFVFGNAGAAMVFEFWNVGATLRASANAVGTNGVSSVTLGSIRHMPPGGIVLVAVAGRSSVTTGVLSPPTQGLDVLGTGDNNESVAVYWKLNDGSVVNPTLVANSNCGAISAIFR